MAPDTALQKGIQRIGELLEQIESTADPNLRVMAKELLESVMAFHGAAVERVMEIVSAAGDPGAAIIRKCSEDGLVSSLLLLYGLHPENLDVRVARALEKNRTTLDSHAAHAELVSIGDDGRVVVRLHLKPSGCSSTAAAMKSALEAALQDAAPDAAAIVVEEVGAASGGSGFVPVGQLLGTKGLTAVLAGQAQGTGE